MRPAAIDCSGRRTRATAVSATWSADAAGASGRICRASARPDRSAALEREIRKPNEVIPIGFETVTVVTRDGRKIRGARKNEDTFSIQLMTANEDILSFHKKDLAEVVPEPERSLMPVYGPERLSDAELADIVRYLRTLQRTVGLEEPAG